MNRVLKSILFLVIAVGFAQAQAQDAVTLRYKMGKNEKFIYQTTKSMKQVKNVEIDGQEQKLETTILTTSIDVRSLKKMLDENLQIRTENKKLSVRSHIASLGEYNYDSESDENDTSSMLGAAMTPLFDILNGAELSYTMTPLGKITEYKSYQELLGESIKNNKLAAQFMAGASEETGKMELSQTFPFFSEKPVKKGDQWEQSLEFTMAELGSFKGKRIFTYAGTDSINGRTTSKITMTLEMTIDIDVKLGGSDVKGKLEVTESSGTYHFDPIKGQLVSADLKIVTKGNLTKITDGMETPVATSQTQTVKSILLDKLPE